MEPDPSMQKKKLYYARESELRSKNIKTAANIKHWGVLLTNTYQESPRTPQEHDMRTPNSSRSRNKFSHDLSEHTWRKAIHQVIQCTTKPTVRLVRPAKTQISLRIRTVWSESSLIACKFYSLQAIQRGINENPCCTVWSESSLTTQILLYVLSCAGSSKLL